MAIEAILSDFGGVLTTPLLGSFAAFQDETGIPMESLGRAMARLAERDGEHPLFELDASRWGLARTLAGAFDDGLLVAVVALRPAGAAGHGEEAVAAVLVREGEPTLVDEALLSVEYDGAGGARRVGLEVYESPDSLPLRIAGDRVEVEGDRTILAMRVDGVAGRGQLAVIRPA